VAVREVLDKAFVLQAEVAALNDLLTVQERVVIDQSARLEQAVHEARTAQQRWQSTFDAIEDLVAVIDKDHRILAANEAVRKAAPCKEVVGMHCYELFHGTASPRPNCPFEESRRTGKPARADWCEPYFQGRWFDVRIFPILGKDGSVEQLVHVVRDMTERRKADEALAESTKGLRDIFEKAADGILIADVDAKRFSGCNPMICQMLGYTPEEIVTLGLPDIHPAKDLPYVMDQVQRQARKEFALAKDLPVRRKDGAVFYADVNAVPMTLRGRKCLVGFFRDVTDRKLAQEKLKLYAADLERANEEVKQFAYIVSHDFRAPLVNLKGFAGEIRSSLSAVASALEAALPHLSEEQRKAAAAALKTDIPEALHFIETAASNMDNHVNALLKLSRLGRQELHPERLRVAEIVERSLKALAHQIGERGVTVSVGPLPEVVADRTAMEQIMGNILANAVLYLEPGRPGRIEVGGSRGPNETAFFVRDNGRGVAPEDMPKVFAPFRRAGKQDVKGEGMGLAYVRTLVRRHGGEIRCESQPGVGTTFTFTIRNSIKKEKHNAHTATD
jgi:PAS domain S-box-containing protein